MSDDKKYPGNFYKKVEPEEAPDNCPNCMYQYKEAEKHVDECPNCHYIPKKTCEEHKPEA